VLLYRAVEGGKVSNLLKEDMRKLEGGK
jgi:hypothetical protein